MSKAEIFSTHSRVKIHKRLVSTGIAHGGPLSVATARMTQLRMMHAMMKLSK
jgi:hypothetical protein